MPALATTALSLSTKGTAAGRQKPAYFRLAGPISPTSTIERGSIDVAVLRFPFCALPHYGHND